jgi:AAA15 family ATPase/GTPase
MEQNHLKSFEVSGFKKFTDLKIDNIGQFNLIIGDNNVGKTSLLEALCANKNLQEFYKGLGSINYHIRKNQDLKQSFLHQYFPFDFKKYPQKISITSISNTDSDKGYFIKLTRINDNQIFSLSELFSNVHLLDPDEKGSTVEFNLNKHSFALNIPYIPFGALYQHELTEEYSKYIQLFIDKKANLIKSLSNILKDIINIEVNASYSANPILLIAEKGKNALLPLATYGDGTVKLFRILLSLFSTTHYNRLMIDELDAGIHHSHLQDFTKSLLQVAKAEQKQIFATTHSKECIESFIKALEETGMQSEGRIIHLADTKNGIKAYTMKFEEFENSILAESEIR